MSLLLASQRVRVRVLARDPVFLRTVFSGDRHRAPGIGIVETFPQPVLQLALAKPETGAQAANHVRHLAHVLHAAGEHDVGFLKLHVLSRGDHRLDTRSAEPIHGQRGHMNRQARLEPHMTRAVVRVDAALLDVAEDDVVHPRGLDGGALERRARCRGAEIDRRDILQRTHVLGHRRARATDNEYGFGH